MKKPNNKTGEIFCVAGRSISWHRLLRRTLVRFVHYSSTASRHILGKSKGYAPVLSFFLTAISSPSLAQTQKFDIISYTAPKDFKKEAKPGVVNFTTVNSANGTFCVITIYASTISTGNAQKDFSKDWNELVVKPFKATASPSPETQTTADGWKVVTAAAPIKLDGNNMIIILSVASGFGKAISIRSSMNDAAYATQVDALFASMELDKTSQPIMTNNTPATTLETTAANGKFGAMLYTAPVGWRHQIFGDGVVFKPLDLPADEHLAMQIMQPLNFAGTLEQALAKSYDEAAAMYKSTKMYYAGGDEYKKTEPQKSFAGWEYIQGNGGVQVENGTPYKTELGLQLFVIKVANRFERVAILQSRKNCNLSRYYAADRQAYKNAIDKFLFTLQFTDGSEALLKNGTIKGGGIMGVWQGISLQTSASSGIRYAVYSPIFLSNGQAYFGPKFPTEGLDGMDTRIPAELYRRDWGTYTFSNGSGVLKMRYGNMPLRMEGDKLIITVNQTAHRFFQLQPVDGARFSGDYTMAVVNGKTPYIRFSADGKFTDNGALKVLYHEYIDCLNPAALPGAGTYEVKDFTIHFTYNDGRKVAIAFLGTDYNKSNPSPPTLRLSFDDNVLTRQ